MIDELRALVERWRAEFQRVPDDEAYDAGYNNGLRFCADELAAVIERGGWRPIETMPDHLPLGEMLWVWSKAPFAVSPFPIRAARVGACQFMREIISFQ